MSLKKTLEQFKKLGLSQTTEIEKEGTDELIRLSFDGKKIVVENIDTGDSYSTDKLTKNEVKEFYELIKDHPLNKMKSCGDWDDTYKPQENHLNENASFCVGDGISGNGGMYETYGDELAYVLEINKTTPKRVWTLLEADGMQFISSGYHLVNRLGYFITEKEAVKEDEEYFVD